jgi:hypothetical protein
VIEIELIIESNLIFGSHYQIDGAPYHAASPLYKPRAFFENKTNELFGKTRHLLRQRVPRRYAVTPLTRPSWKAFSGEFHCPGCGAHEAYRSRPRGFFEAYVLPILFLRPVRCDRCYLRSYVPRSCPARERTELGSKISKSEPAAATTDNNSRVA